MRLLILISVLAIFIGARSVQADTSDPEKMDVQIDLDSVGDGTVEIKERYGAEAWLVWKESTGDHLDRVVRDRNRNFAAWEFYDPSFSKDEVLRIAESKMKVRALAQISNDGTYTLDKLITGLHLVTNKANEWIFSGHSASGAWQSVATEQTVQVNLPAGAFDAHIVNLDSSHLELVYSVDRSATKSLSLLFWASGFGVFGVTMLGIWLRSPNIFRRPLPLLKKNIPPPPALPFSGKWQLVGHTPGGRILRFEITDAMFANNGNRLVLGRTAELCHVVVDDGSVSKQHAQIRKEGNSFTVADRNSSNGTAVNGQFNRLPFNEVPFKDGDTLTLGDVKLDFSKG